MDGLSWITGCGPTITLGGRTLIVRARSLHDYGLIEAEILRRRGNPFDLLRVVARNVNGHKRSDHEIWVPLFNDVVTRWCRVSCADLFRWLDTWPGRFFALWLAVRENDPTRYTLESVVKQADSVEWPQVLEALAIANGEDERGTIDLLTVDDAGADEPIPWSAIYRRLAEQPFCMSASDISELTLRQLRTFLAELSELADRLDFDCAAAMNDWRSRRDARVAQATDNLRRGLRWDAL